MKISELIKNTPCKLIQGNPDTEITSLVYDSRKATPGAMFVAMVGAESDAHKYIPDVIAKGASAIVVEMDRLTVKVPDNVTVISAEDTRLALALLSANWFGHPADKLTTIGITGTKGKTTTSYMVKSILDAAGRKCGLIGTIEIIIGDEHIHSLNTTPESYLVQEYFSEMVKSGMTHVVMEVSSQALKYHRVAGINFDIGIFTNIEPDHIGAGEHTDFNDYMNAKSMLFAQCKLGIFNADAEHLDGILKGHTCSVKSFGLYDGSAREKRDDIPDELTGIPDYAASETRLIERSGSLGVCFHISTGRRADDSEEDIDINMPGSFSVHNALGAIAACRECGVSYDAVKAALSKIRVNGRVELMPVSDKFTVIIDYAHNAMGLESLLTTLKAYKPKRLVTVFGCGGNRARDRRFSMGEVSSRLSDLTVVTSDNPRFEEPMDIINDIITGIKKADGEYTVIPDRDKAIEYSIKNAKPGDVIVIAGKGHEDYQEIKGVRHHMDDHEMVMSCADKAL